MRTPEEISKDQRAVGLAVGFAGIMGVIAIIAVVRSAGPSVTGADSDLEAHLIGKCAAVNVQVRGQNGQEFQTFQCFGPKGHWMWRVVPVGSISPNTALGGQAPMTSTPYEPTAAEILSRKNIEDEKAAEHLKAELIRQKKWKGHLENDYIPDMSLPDAKAILIEEHNRKVGR